MLCRRSWQIPASVSSSVSRGFGSARFFFPYSTVAFRFKKQIPHLVTWRCIQTNSNPFPAQRWAQVR